jgi:copper chaperone NosL
MRPLDGVVTSSKRSSGYQKKEKAMKKVSLCSILFVFSVVLGNALWAYGQDVKEIPACKYCGMNREMFSHSRMLIEYDDGTIVGTCSLHCTALDLALNLDKKPKAIRVGDYGTKALIDAETAAWVIGGNKPGVMTRNAKWAFAKKEDAEKFRQVNGGSQAGFDEAIEAAYQDINADTKMIRERRKMRMKMMEKNN